MNDTDFKNLIMYFNKSTLKKLSYRNEDYIINMQKDCNIKISNPYDEISCTKEDLNPYFIRSQYVCKVITYNHDLSKPFIEISQSVKKGDCLGLLLYLNMKIAIISPVSGIVSEICVKNNQIMDYGQIMFVILEIK